MATAIPEDVKEAEGKALGALLANVKQRSFAKDFGVPGGASMISQHIAGTRPINMEQALAYSAGLGLPIGRFSPRLQAEIDRLAPFASRSATNAASSNLRSEIDKARAAKLRAWPFPRVDQGKITQLEDVDVISLESALLIAAGQLGLDIRRKPSDPGVQGPTVKISNG